jgi:hypothetical protein
MQSDAALVIRIFTTPHTGEDWMRRRVAEKQLSRGCSFSWLPPSPSLLGRRRRRQGRSTLVRSLPTYPPIFTVANNTTTQPLAFFADPTNNTSF